VPGQKLALPTYTLPCQIGTFRLMVEAATAMAQQQYVQAAAAYDKLVAISPSSQLYMLLSESYVKQVVPGATGPENLRVLTLARKAADEALRLNPEAPDALMLKQIVLSRLLMP
jgi:tetratricopeptide (TPR) repeat protein